MPPAAARAVVATASYVNDCIGVYAGFDDSMKTVAATMGMTAEEIANGSKEYEMLLFCFFYLFLLFLVCIL